MKHFCLVRQKRCVIRSLETLLGCVRVIRLRSALGPLQLACGSSPLSYLTADQCPRLSLPRKAARPSHLTPLGNLVFSGKAMVVFFLILNIGDHVVRTF